MCAHLDPSHPGVAPTHHQVVFPSASGHRADLGSYHLSQFSPYGSHHPSARPSSWQMCRLYGPVSQGTMRLHQIPEGQKGETIIFFPYQSAALKLKRNAAQLSVPVLRILMAVQFIRLLKWPSSYIAHCITAEKHSIETSFYGLGPKIPVICRQKWSPHLR